MNYVGTKENMKVALFFCAGIKERFNYEVNKFFILKIWYMVQCKKRL